MTGRLRKVWVGDTEVELTVKEFDALYLLISNRNRILTFETLARQIWGEEYVDISDDEVVELKKPVKSRAFGFRSCILQHFYNKCKQRKEYPHSYFQEQGTRKVLSEISATVQVSGRVP